ncbi:MAG TPA: hypothetical protein PLF61_05760 [Candidatus Goldiibacteriota bacterium]|nr:hypothetical protein [Candidatus Goldiibacteriota bacterium]
MNKVLTILKAGIICALIVFVMQSITFWLFPDKFQEYYKYQSFFVALFKIGIINLVIYLIFSILIFNFFSHLSGNFISRSFTLMAFFVVFKTVPVSSNLFLSTEINLSLAVIFVIMNVLSDVITSFVFMGMFTEMEKQN